MRKSFIESHGNQIKNLESIKQEIKKDIENLEAEINLTKLVLKESNPPTLNPLRKLFARHEKKTEKIKERHEELHKKISDIKEKTEKKKDKIKKKSHRSFW